jgi:hypothetical protein
MLAASIILLLFYGQKKTKNSDPKYLYIPF